VGNGKDAKKTFQKEMTGHHRELLNHIPKKLDNKKRRELSLPASFINI